MKKQFEKERGHLREKRLASQGRPKEGTRLKVMWGGKFYSCSVVKSRYSAQNDPKIAQKDLNGFKVTFEIISIEILPLLRSF